MAKPLTSDQQAANVVRAELLRRGWKTADLAGRIGVSADSATNIIIGNQESASGRKRIEDCLGTAIWSSTEEFFARQNSAEQLHNYESALQQRLTASFAAQQNLSSEFQQLCEKVGVNIILVQFDGDLKSPVWGGADVAKSFEEELDRDNAGSLDSVMMLEKSYFCFYHTRKLGKALSIIKGGIEKMGLLEHARIFAIEAESGWRVYWPATGELFPLK